MSTFTQFAGSVSDSPGAAHLMAVERLMESLVSGGSFSDSEQPDTVRAALSHLASGGHRVRASLGLHASLRLGLSESDATAIAATVELLHNASLVHDDLQDGEMIRRGVPTVFAAYGSDIAVLVGDLLLSAAYAAIAQFSRPAMIPEMIRLIHQRTTGVIRGQCGDLSARNQPVTDLARYETIVAGKSGALLSLPLELALLGAGFRDSTELAHEAAQSFGIGYQIVDDLDDAENDGPLSLNILTILAAENTPTEADSVAREIGLRHLQSAMSVAARLPRGSGELLGKLARAWSERL